MSPDGSGAREAIAKLAHFWMEKWSMRRAHSDHSLTQRSQTVIHRAFTDSSPLSPFNGQEEL
jgi:hypothetical protein